MSSVAIRETKREMAELHDRPDQSQLMAVIARAASDPTIDVSKMERLVALYERAEQREAEKAFNKAMSAAQAEMKSVRADASNPQTKSKYASFAALDSALRPIYTQHGFGLSFDTGDAPHADKVRVLCYVSHNDGHSRTYRLDMAADGKGAKGGDVMTKTHATGSALTYAQRYLLKAIFNIAVGDDDDGNGASETGGFISEYDAEQMLEFIQKQTGNVEKFCRFMKVDALHHIPANRKDEAWRRLNEGAVEKQKAAQK